MLAVMLALFAACEYLPLRYLPVSFGGKPKETRTPTATPTPSSTPTPTPSPIPTATKKRRHHKRSAKASAGPSAGVSPTATATAPPAISTSGEAAAARNDIAQTLKQVEARISRIKRSTLSPQDANDYDRIMLFIADARSALKQQDELRARSLADKAARLASQLLTRVSSP